MDKPFVGYEKKYADNYNKIFRKPLKERIINWINNLLIKLFIK